MKQGAARLAEVLGGLSLACDLADGCPPDKVLRTALVAIAVGRHHGLSQAQLHDLYYVTLLRYLGCTGFSHEETLYYGAGDDIATRRAMSLADQGQRGYTLRRIVLGIGGSGPVAQGVRAVARLLGDGVAVARHARAQCETSVRMAKLVGLGPGVQAALEQVCERWDGRGAPARIAAEALEPVIRVYVAADVFELAVAEHGPRVALEQLERRAGGQLDPDVVRSMQRHADEILAVLATTQPFEDFLAAEPAPHAMADDERLDDVALAFAHMTDLKSSFTVGHSTSVARIAQATATALGLPEDERRDLRRAALLHDLGRLAISNAVWDKRGSFSAADRERARLHAYFTERVLWQAPPLRGLAVIASAAHERLDGSGYHRAMPAAATGTPARVLAASDVFAALREPRPHRPAHDANAAARILVGEARAGRLDASVVRALLDTHDAPAPRRGAWPKGLSDREVQILVLVARGRTNKEIARETGLSPKTVQHHVAHVYEKVGLQSRAGAAIFAAEAGLLHP